MSYKTPKGFRIFLDSFIEQVKIDPKVLSLKELPEGYTALEDAYYNISYILDDWEHFSLEDRLKLKELMLIFIRKIMSTMPKWIEKQEDFLNDVLKLELSRQ